MVEPLDKRHEAIESFLQSLRISFNFISLYSKEHKSFVASVKDLHGKAREFLAAVSPARISFAVNALSIEGEVFGKKTLYVELARLFHMRKIKSIEILPEITEAELIAALDKIALPVKEVLKQGGLHSLLEGAQVSHLKIEELDYSAFLKDEGEESADIWSYIINDTLNKGDPRKIQDLVENFEQVIGKFKVKHFLEDPRLNANVRQFLGIIKQQDPAALQRCAKAMLRLILLDKQVPRGAEVDKLKHFLDDIQAGDVAEALVEEIVQHEEFDDDHLGLFVKLIDIHRHQEIAVSLEHALARKGALNPKTAKKMRQLFSLSDSPLVQDMYQRVLASLDTQTDAVPTFAFDPAQTQRCYQDIQLFLLQQEQDPGKLEIIAQSIDAEWAQAVSTRDEAYIQRLITAIDEKWNRYLGAGLEHLAQTYLRYIESAALAGTLPAELEVFLPKLKKTTLGFEAYADVFFNQRRVDREILKLFFQLFPDQQEQFFALVSRAIGDREYIGSFIDELAHAESVFAVETLEHIYSQADDELRLDILMAMGNLPDFDAGFLSRVMREAGPGLRKEALRILVYDEETRGAALDMFFSIANPWGSKNALVLENLSIAEELDLKESADTIRALMDKTPFWNMAVRKKAKQILEAWNAG
ncbi:MAG TPA: hypothetical protein P5110_03430 [Candidatus Omnitrophota bacterium]|nr:hypothetical protein [Candidatus Omnitrophota bacterium]HRZ14542.1 hypothetical protein [Candidatus Omnitrophota bacterium]